MQSKTTFTTNLLASAALVLGLAAAGPVAAQGKIYSVSDLDVVRQVAPDYPKAAARGGFDGWVVLEFTVTPSGDVSDAEVKESSSKIFHREALVALANWQFKPVMEGGQASPVRAQLKFTFQGQ